MIAAVPVGMSVEIEGLDGLRQRIEARIREQCSTDVSAISVTTSATSGKGGSRSAATNRMMAGYHANEKKTHWWRRDPFYVNAKWWKLIRAAVPGLFAGSSIASRTADTIGEMMVLSVQENIAAQRNSDGSPFTQLTTGYALRKQRKWGHIVPILEASSDFKGSFKALVTRQ